MAADSVAPAVPTARVHLAYDGTDFTGWAVQPGKRSVEGELKSAIEQISGQTPTLYVAGRTDRGVHAQDQVVSHPGEAVGAEALNSVLPPDIAVTQSYSAPGFDARADATSRAYRYRVIVSRIRPVDSRRTALWHPKPVDVDVLHACAAMLPGKQNMTAFTPPQTHHVWFDRDIITARWAVEETHEGLQLDFLIEAVSFMRHMNRILVGTMLETARGVSTVEHFEALVAGKPRAEAGATAFAKGLTMLGVGYGEPVLG